MRRFLPRMTIVEIAGTDATLAEELDIRARGFIFSWFGLVVEISFGRHV